MSDAKADPRMREHLPRSLWPVLAGLTLVWGANWTAMKVALSEIAPWTFRAICLAAGSGVLFAVLRLKRQPIAIPRSEWRNLVLVAFFNITLWNVLVAFGVRLIPSGRAAILAYTMPALAIPLSVWLLNERMTARKLIALALGMGGIVLLVADEFTRVQAAPLGVALMLGAALAWAVGTVVQKKYPIDAPLAGLTAWLMFVGGVPIYCVAIALDLRHALSAGLDPAGFGIGPVVALAYNVFLAFAWGYWAWIKLVESVSVTVFSICMLMTPVVGVFSGMLFLGERPSPAEYGALALVLASLATVALAPAAKGEDR